MKDEQFLNRAMLLRAVRNACCFRGHIGTALLMSAISALPGTNAVAAEGNESNSTPAVLEEVVIKAEKRARSLQDTATSVAVFSQQDLEQHPGMDSVLDLVGRVGNMTLDGKSGKAPAVRGIDGTGPANGANAFLGGTRSRLAYQIDGRPLGFNETVYGNSGLWDVQQVEVLRGPQSTLQGRNAIAGTISIHTRDPSFDWEGAVRAIGGNYNTHQESFYVSGPIMQDQLAFRVAYDRSEYNSFMHVTENYPGVDDPRHYVTTTARAKLLIQPTALEGFKTLLTVNRMEFKGPQTEIATYPFENHIEINGYMPRFAPRSSSAIAATTWELGSGFTFENTLSYSKFLVSRYSFPGDGNARIDGHEAVFEPRIRYSSSDGRMDALFGVYHYQARQDEFLDLIGGMSFRDATTNTAAFAEINYKLTDQLELTVGGREERESRDRHGGNFFVVNLDKTYNTFLPKVGLAYHATRDFTVGAVVSRSYNGGGAAFTFQPPFVNYEYNPEYVWNYEAYWRAKMLDDRLQLTGNVFYSNYKDFQLEFDINPDPAIYSFVVRNAKRVYTYGSELGLRWLLVPGLTVSADGGLQKTKIADYPGNSVEGNELPRAPRVTGGFTLAYAHASGLDLSADARYSDWFYSDVINRPSERTDPYWSANAQVGYTFHKIRVFAICQNLFDHAAVLGLTRGVTQAGDLAFLQWPRTYKAGFQVTF